MSITHWKIRWGNPPTWPLSNHLVETFCQVLTNKLCVWTSDLSPLYSTCIWCSITKKKYNIKKNDTNTNIPPLSSCLLYLISEWFKYMNELNLYLIMPLFSWNRGFFSLSVFVVFILKTTIEIIQLYCLACFWTILQGF